MIEAWLNLPAAGVFAVLTLVYAGTATAISYFGFGMRFRRLVARIDGIVPAYFGAVSVLFALLTGFLAGDIGDRNRQASRAVQSEAGELRNVFTLSVASASDMRSIRAAWTVYVKTAVADDWPAMAHGENAASTNAAYDELLREVSDPKIAVEAGAAVHAALLTAAVRIGTARSDRLALSSDRTNDLKWAIVIILGVMTQISIGLVHLKRRGANVTALAVFSISVVFALGMLAMQERPFDGAFRISAAPVQVLLKLQGP
jgi:hypothetical protein